MDFSKLKTPAQSEQPVDPIKIFDQLPTLRGTPNDLWRGQAEALKEWNQHRTKKDVLLSLNTGAGKTLLGLLVAQSLVNEGVENVVYLCGTIDLVNQTSHEAARLGVQHSTRTYGKFNNRLFQSGKSFCITTYHTLFNGLSSIQRRHPPGAVIFDDAHVAETILRNSLTLRVGAESHPALYTKIAELFEPHFNRMRLTARFKGAVSGNDPSIVMAPPNAMQECENQLLAELRAHNITEDENMKYAYAALQDKLHACAVFFGYGSIEITPPFLPSLALEIFQNSARRIYLSATMGSKADLVRAFGRLPDEVIEPDSDAGNGERLVLFSGDLDGTDPIQVVSKVKEQHKVLIAVPSYASAETWESIAIPPTTNSFSSELESFRRSDSGAFVLVSRVDGIDLPHDSCRVMVIDGLPYSASLIERYQWEFLGMRNQGASRIANRLVQLFGRINRGRKDFGAFLVEGVDLSIWLSNDRFVALLPDLLQQQILLGRTAQEGLGLNDTNSIVDAVDAVLNRDSTWIEYYGSSIQSASLSEDALRRARESEILMIESALGEAKYAQAMWLNDLVDARSALEAVADKTGDHDPLHSGWQHVWVGDVLEREGDTDSALISYKEAMIRLGNRIQLPRVTETNSPDTALTSAFAKNVFNIAGLTELRKFEKQLVKLEARLSALNGGTSNQMEEATRCLGEVLGFTATRPDNEFGTGPDVVWFDDASNSYAGFELKTDKNTPAIYYKKEVGQGHDHLSWMVGRYVEGSCLGIYYVGPDGSVEARANPSDLMLQINATALQHLGAKVVGIVRDVRQQVPIEREGLAEEICGSSNWNLGKVCAGLNGTSLNEMEVQTA